MGSKLIAAVSIAAVSIVLVVGFALIHGPFVYVAYVVPDDYPSIFLTSANNSIDKPDFPKDIDKKKIEYELSKLYGYIESITAVCHSPRRMGNEVMGGWDICVTPPYTPEEGCIVYSYGINFDFSFDDAMYEEYNCSVFSYDPSMHTESHQRSPGVMYYNLGLGGRNFTNNKGWHLMTFAEMLADNGHEEEIIDVLKMDIEVSEWSALEQMLADGSLNRVKQLAVEFHSWYVTTGNQMYYRVFKGLEEAGFVKWYVHRNLWCSRRVNGIPVVMCHEISFLNTNFLNVKTLR